MILLTVGDVDASRRNFVTLAYCRSLGYSDRIESNTSSAASRSSPRSWLSLLRIPEFNFYARNKWFCYLPVKSGYNQSLIGSSVAYVLSTFGITLNAGIKVLSFSFKIIFWRFSETLWRSLAVSLCFWSAIVPIWFKASFFSEGG